MLNNAIAMCPPDRWNTNRQFYFMSYHTVVFLDYYLTVPPAARYNATLPFTLIDPDHLPEGAIDDVLPDKTYSQQEVLEWLKQCREKCRNVIMQLTETSIQQPWLNDKQPSDLSLASMGSRPYTVLQILFYNLRHVQHHAAQLNLLLRQSIGDAPMYVSEASD